MEMINVSFLKGNIWFKLKLKGNEGEEFEKLQLMMDRVGLDVRNIPNLKHLSSGYGKIHLRLRQLIIITAGLAF